MEKFIAHIRVKESGEKEYQLLSEHCRNTAKYAGDCLKHVDLNSAAYLAGLLHDVGKYKTEFQTYLEDENGIRGSVNHTFAGCRIALELFHNKYSTSFQDVSSEIIAYGVGAHHGLFDCIDQMGKYGFDHRLNKAEIGYHESCENFYNNCAEKKEIKELFIDAHSQLEKKYKKIIQLSQDNGDKTGEELSFYLGLLARLIASAVIDGDRHDTAAFMKAYTAANHFFVNKEFWTNYLNVMERKLREFSQDTSIQKARSSISDICRKKADEKGGIYRLNIPTGSGKTLDSLRYGLEHAAKWNKDRIIYVMPLLSILEQNAAVIKKFLGDEDIVLEHHSDIVAIDESEKEKMDERELALDSWNAPIVITTLVQLLNTIFLGKTTSVRRFQALCNAVIIIDEVQTVPDHMVSLFNLAVNFLSVVCNTTFVLCSATQPCFESVKHSLLLGEHPDIVPYDEKLWNPFKRTILEDAGAYQLAQMPEWLGKIIDVEENLLIICNKKQEAEFLFNELRTKVEKCFHLSASMCMEHRKDVLHEIEVALKMHKKIVCVSTQVMEAGIDISFRCVVRFAAGMDSIIQAAGRCNRNSEVQQGKVYIVQCVDERLQSLKEIQRSKDVTISLLQVYKNNEAFFGYDLFSDKAIDWYYQKLFKEENSLLEFQDFYVKDKRSSILNMLSGNTQYYSKDSQYDKYTLNQAFKMAGKEFKVFDDNTQTVVVPYKGGIELIDELECCNDNSIGYIKSWIQQAKIYTVSVYDYQLRKIENGIRCIKGVMVLSPEYYDENTGLVIKDELTFLEV